MIRGCALDRTLIQLDFFRAMPMGQPLREMAFEAGWCRILSPSSVVFGCLQCDAGLLFTK